MSCPHIPLSNASSATSRLPSHGSGPGWFATPFPVWIFHPLLHAGLSRRDPSQFACLPDRSYRCKLKLTGQPRLFYVRAERASLPSHASDLLSARLQAIGGTRTFTSQDSVAVGTTIARRPPRGPVLALLTHTVLTSEAWRRSAPWGTGAGRRPPGAGYRSETGSVPRSNGAVGSVAVAGVATFASRLSGTGPASLRCPGSRGS